MHNATIRALNVYPVKSCRGVAAESADVATTGLSIGGVRDREWMIVDRRGRFVTQREAPRLALVEIRVENGALSLRAPGVEPFAPEPQGASRDVVVWNTQVRGFDTGDAAADALSAFIGRDVRLVRFDDGRPRRCNPDYAGDTGATTLYSDGYPLLVIGQASLDDLNARLSNHGFKELPMNRFRPNLIVDGLDPYEEDHVDTLAAGDVVLKLVKRCVRCEITTTDQDSGARNIEPLRTLSTYRRDDRLGGVTFGMNAVVVTGAGSGLRVGQRTDVELRF